MQEAVGIVAVLGVLLVAYYFVLGRRLGIGHILDDRGHRVSSADFGGTAAVFLEGVDRRVGDIRTGGRRR